MFKTEDMEQAIFRALDERIVRTADATRGRATVVAAEIAERMGEEIGESTITQAEAEEFGRRYTKQAFTFALNYEPQITDAFRDNFNIDADAVGIGDRRGVGGCCRRTRAGVTEP